MSSTDAAKDSELGVALDSLQQFVVSDDSKGKMSRRNQVGLTEREVRTRIEDVEAADLRNVSFWLGPFVLDCQTQTGLTTNDGRPACVVIDQATMTLKIDPILRGRMLFFSVLEKLAEAYEWFFPAPGSDDERFRMMATFAMAFFYSIEGEVDLSILAAPNEKSGTPQDSEAVPPESKDSNESRDATAA